MTVLPWATTGRAPPAPGRACPHRLRRRAARLRRRSMQVGPADGGGLAAVRALADHGGALGAAPAAQPFRGVHLRGGWRGLHRHGPRRWSCASGAPRPPWGPPHARAAESLWGADRHTSTCCRRSSSVRHPEVCDGIQTDSRSGWHETDIGLIHTRGPGTKYIEVVDLDPDPRLADCTSARFTSSRTASPPTTPTATPNTPYRVPPI